MRLLKTERFINPKIFDIGYGQKTIQKEEKHTLQNWVIQIEVIRQEEIQGLKEIQQTSRNCEKFYFCSVFCPNSFLGGRMFYEQLKNFNNFLLLDKGLTEVTRKGHLKSISIVLKKVELPREDEFRNHILWMYEKKYSYSHISNTITSIEYFSEFLGSPIKFKKIRRPKKLIEHYLTEAEISCMIRDTKDLREKAMVVFLAYTGLRNKEFCNVRVKDLDFGNNQVFVRQGKFSRDRRVNLGYQGTNVLIDYIMENKKKKEDYLFTTIKKKNKYTTSDLRKLISVLAKRAKIKKKVFPHLFRHSLATNLILRGANILLVKEQLGHTDIQTTMNYIQRLPIHTIKTQYDYHAPAYI